MPHSGPPTLCQPQRTGGLHCLLPMKTSIASLSLPVTPLYPQHSPGVLGRPPNNPVPFERRGVASFKTLPMSHGSLWQSPAQEGLLVQRPLVSGAWGPGREPQAADPRVVIGAWEPPPTDSTFGFSPSAVTRRWGP